MAKRTIKTMLVILVFGIFRTFAQELLPTERLQLAAFADQLIHAAPLLRLSQMPGLDSKSPPDEYRRSYDAVDAAHKFCLQASKKAPSVQCEKYASLAAVYYRGFGEYLKAYAKFAEFGGTQNDIAAIKQLEEQYQSAKSAFDHFVEQLDLSQNNNALPNKEPAAQQPAEKNDNSSMQLAPATAKGVPALQEVEAAGQGANADDAFKQAVVDAVRQVVGTLVSAENVVNNDRVIKDQVLTLSNGFVEKVIKQEKSKSDDGTWQVKLKCMVRKGQVYDKLRTANVPTVKFDGLSIFADVVSQLDQEQSAIKMISELDKDWDSLFAATMIDSKLEIVSRDAQITEIRIKWEVNIDANKLINNIGIKLRDILLHSGCRHPKTPKKYKIYHSKIGGESIAQSPGYFGMSDGTGDDYVAVCVGKDAKHFLIDFYLIENSKIKRYMYQQVYSKKFVAECELVDIGGNIVWSHPLIGLRFANWGVLSYIPLFESNRQTRAGWASSSEEGQDRGSFFTGDQGFGFNKRRYSSKLRIPTEILARISTVRFKVKQGQLEEVRDMDVGE